MNVIRFDKPVKRDRFKLISVAQVGGDLTDLPRAIPSCDQRGALVPSLCEQARASSACYVAKERTLAADDGSDALTLVGLNYRSADVGLRSRVALSGPKLQRLLDQLREHGVREATVLSTCNRTEIYTAGADVATVIRLLESSTGVGASEFRPHLYIKSGACAACHLFRVASGLDSAVLGETEIVAQVKGARRDATLDGPLLDLLFRHALIASKRVRTETELCRNASSLATLAMREASRAAGPLRELRVLVVGAGRIGERLAKELQSVGAANVTIASRTSANAEALATRFGYSWGSLEILPSLVEGADVIFAGVTSDTPLITRENTSERPEQVFVDLGIPPNVDLPGARTIDVDAIAKRCEENERIKNAAIPAALNIIECEVRRFLDVLAERQVTPTVRRLVQHGERVRSRTLDWALGQLPELSERERRVVEDMARRLVLGMLAPPIEELKKGAFSADERSTMERAFRISPASHDGGEDRC